MSSSSSAGEFESLGQRPEMSYAQFEQLGLLRFDCNANGIFDDIEIEQGAPDADGNGVPDACEGGQPSSVSNPAIADRPLRALGNPVVSLSRFVFSLAWPGRATVTIHDVTGRLIRVLLDGSLEAGDHEVSWTGTDDGSRPVVPGVYFVRLQAKGRDERAKIVMIR
jgi:hypothetical protein